MTLVNYVKDIGIDNLLAQFKSYFDDDTMECPLHINDGGPFTCTICPFNNEWSYSCLCTDIMDNAYETFEEVTDCIMKTIKDEPLKAVLEELNG